MDQNPFPFLGCKDTFLFFFSVFAALKQKFFVPQGFKLSFFFFSWHLGRCAHLLQGVRRHGESHLLKRCRRAIKCPTTFKSCQVEGEKRRLDTSETLCFGHSREF